MIFTRMLRLGPLVSFNGSPIVSPITDAPCCGVCLNPVFSSSFFPLSHAPPVLDEEIAICTPLMRAPAKIPATPLGPNKKPATKGVNITKHPGAIISVRAASVAMATHLSVLGTKLGSKLNSENTASFVSKLVSYFLNHFVGCHTH